MQQDQLIDAVGAEVAQRQVGGAGGAVVDAKAGERLIDVGDPGVQADPQPVLEIGNLHEVLVEGAELVEDGAVHHHRGRLADEVSAPVLEGQPRDLVGRDVGAARQELADLVAAHLAFHQRLLGLADALVEEEAATDRHPVLAARRLEQPLDRGRGEHVVDVHELDPLAPGQLDAPVAIGHQADVGVVGHDPDARIPLRPGGQQGGGVVGRLVVDHQDVEVAVGLLDDRLQAALEERVAVVDRDADGDDGTVHAPRPASVLRTKGNNGRIPTSTMTAIATRSVAKRAIGGMGRTPTRIKGTAQAT